LIYFVLEFIRTTEGEEWRVRGKEEEREMQKGRNTKLNISSFIIETS
jgi:hypothetical protein